MTWQVWELRKGDSYAEIANLGATLLRWRVRGNFPVITHNAYGEAVASSERVEGYRDIIDGYRNETEAKTLDGYRSAVLAPWANRLAGGEYTFAGESYNARRAGVGGEQALHGLVADCEFELVESATEYIVLKTLIPAGKAYPFQVELKVEYRLGDGELSAKFTATNLDKVPVPIALGWHPYFKTQMGLVDTATVTIPAQILVDTDADLIPLADLNAYQPGANPITLAHRKDLDFGYTHLVTKDGIAQARLEHGDGTATLVEIHNGVTGIGGASFQVYSAQDLEVRRELSMAIEPLTTITNAFNRPDCTQYVTTLPGEEKQLHVVLKYEF